MGRKSKKAGQIGWIAFNTILGLMSGLCASGEVFWKEVQNTYRKMAMARIDNGNKI